MLGDGPALAWCVSSGPLEWMLLERPPGFRPAENVRSISLSTCVYPARLKQKGPLTTAGFCHNVCSEGPQGAVKRLHTVYIVGDAAQYVYYLRLVDSSKIKHIVSLKEAVHIYELCLIIYQTPLFLKKINK